MLHTGSIGTPPHDLYLYLCQIGSLSARIQGIDLGLKPRVRILFPSQGKLSVLPTWSLPPRQLKYVLKDMPEILTLS